MNEDHMAESTTHAREKMENGPMSKLCLCPDKQDGYISRQNGMMKMVGTGGYGMPDESREKKRGVERQGEAAEAPGTLTLIAQTAADKDPQKELSTNYMMKQH